MTDRYLGGALEARGIRADQGRLASSAVGQVELEGMLLVLKRIHVRYQLQADAGTDRPTVERVHGFHAQRCPVYRSIHPQITCSTELEMVTVGTGDGRAGP